MQANNKFAFFFVFHMFDYARDSNLYVWKYDDSFRYYTVKYEVYLPLKPQVFMTKLSRTKLTI